MAEELLERAYWIIVNNVIQPIQPDQVISESEVDEVADLLREYLNG